MERLSNFLLAFELQEEETEEEVLRFQATDDT